MGSVDLQMGGAIKSSNREGNFDQQNSVEEDMLILDNLCAKEKVSTGKLAKNNKFPNFTDLSLIEGNKSIGLNTGSRQGGLQMTGSIKKEGGGSLYSGGSSLL